jgi:hypothetical protein
LKVAKNKNLNEGELNLIRRFFSFVSVLLIVSGVVSCGGEDPCENEDCQIEDQSEEATEMTLRIISDVCAKDTINSSSLAKLGSLAVTISDVGGLFISENLSPKVKLNQE